MRRSGEYLDHLLRDGYSVRHDEHLSDPDLIDPGANMVGTWREDYPLRRAAGPRHHFYEENHQLQIERPTGGALPRGTV